MPSANLSLEYKLNHNGYSTVFFSVFRYLYNYRTSRGKIVIVIVHARYSDSILKVRKGQGANQFQGEHPDTALQET